LKNVNQSVSNQFRQEKHHDTDSNREANSKTQAIMNKMDSNIWRRKWNKMKKTYLSAIQERVAQSTTWWGSSIAVLVEKPLPIGVLPIDPRGRQGKHNGRLKISD